MCMEMFTVDEEENFTFQDFFLWVQNIFIECREPFQSTKKNKKVGNRRKGAVTQESVYTCSEGGVFKRLQKVDRVL